MDQSISKERQLYEDFIGLVGGQVRRRIFRADGTIEDTGWIENQVAAAGLNDLASRSIVTSHSAGFTYIAIGSGTAASSLGSTALIGEVDRKASITPVTSRSMLILTNTWGGFADSITSVALDEAGIFNAAAAGTMLNKVLGVAATLADSDILNLEMTFKIGSHAL